jgi:hypothetical protein
MDLPEGAMPALRVLYSRRDWLVPGLVLLVVMVSVARV